VGICRRVSGNWGKDASGYKATAEVTDKEVLKKVPSVERTSLFEPVKCPVLPEFKVLMFL